MTEDELRTLVRESVERHLGRPVPAPRPAASPVFRLHASHARFPVVSGGEADGPCLIEPVIHCVHCGYCQSYGH